MSSTRAGVTPALAPFRYRGGGSAGFQVGLGRNTGRCGPDGALLSDVGIATTTRRATGDLGTLHRISTLQAAQMVERAQRSYASMS